MKVLFVGEGPTDIGRDDYWSDMGLPGPIQILTKKIVPILAAHYPAIGWRDVPLFPPDGKKGGFKTRQGGLDRKAAAAILTSARKYDCAGTILVHDRDAEIDQQRLEALEKGNAEGLNLVNADHRVVCGLAIETIEAWTLGAPTALCKVLGVDEQELRKIYKPVDAERFNPNSGKEEKRSKDLLEQCATLGKRKPNTEFRVAVAENTDVAELERHCPEGFKPFAAALREAFGKS